MDLKKIRNVPLVVIAVFILFVAFVINLHAQPQMNDGKGGESGGKKASSGDFRFNPQNLVVSEFKGRWAVMESTNANRAIVTFAQNRKSDAKQTLKIMQHYGMNEKYFVGTSALVFFLASGKAREDPSPFSGEKCQRFDPKNVTVEEKTITSKKNPNEVLGT